MSGLEGELSAMGMGPNGGAAASNGAANGAFRLA